MATDLSIEEFLIARIKEHREMVQYRERTIYGRHTIAILDQQLKIIEWHKNWPVMVESEPEYIYSIDGQNDLLRHSVTSRVVWLTQESYIKCFGTASPTAPILRIMAAAYSYHPDYNLEWRD